MAHFILFFLFMALVEMGFSKIGLGLCGRKPSTKGERQALIQNVTFCS